jgi:hypothetical protein
MPAQSGDLRGVAPAPANRTIPEPKIAQVGGRFGFWEDITIG